MVLIGLISCLATMMLPALRKSRHYDQVRVEEYWFFFLYLFFTFFMNHFLLSLRCWKRIYQLILAHFLIMLLGPHIEDMMGLSSDRGSGRRPFLQL